MEILCSQEGNEPQLNQLQSGTSRKRPAKVGFTFSFFNFIFLSFILKDVYTAYVFILQDEADSIPTKRSHHACEISGKVFTWLDKLKRHEETHISEKQHQSDKCDTSFHRKLNLDRHKNQVLERRVAQQEYHYTTCGEEFHNVAPFWAHKKTAHSQPTSTATKRPSVKKSGKNHWNNLSLYM